MFHRFEALDPDPCPVRSTDPICAENSIAICLASVTQSGVRAGCLSSPIWEREFAATATSKTAFGAKLQNARGIGPRTADLVAVAGEHTLQVFEISRFPGACGECSL
jgi:hypothetical protein